MEQGLYDVIARVPSGTVVWDGDNSAANSWARASWSPVAERNGIVRVRAAVMERRRVDVEIRQCGGGADNVADILTRELPGSRMLDARASWERELIVPCGCEDLCGHVREALRRMLQL